MDRIEKFLRYISADKGRSALTLKTYRADLENFCAYLQATDRQLDWQDVDRDLIRGWVAQMMETHYKPTYGAPQAECRAFVLSVFNATRPGQPESGGRGKGPKLGSRCPPSCVRKS